MTEALLLHPRYAAGEVLGRGAQGVVLRVTDREEPSRALVAKLWQPGAFDESALAGEFALLRRLSIPGLVGAHDWGRDERTHAPFLVEDFVAGEAAFDFVQRAPELRAQRLSSVLSAVTTTLAALHDAAFVHGDLKPAHVRVTPQGDVRLLDLGSAVARARRPVSEPSAFTPAFAAPELLAGGSATPSSDLFSLGALAWALATGAAPGARSQGLRTLAPWVPPSMSSVIEQLLARHPRDRPEAANDVLQQLGLAGLSEGNRAAPAPIGRERELARLSEAKPGVRYLCGPSGSGKSHLLRELVTQALLAGRPVRRVSFPSADHALLAQLIAFFRGADAAWPFTARASADKSVLLFALDDVHAAPPEFAAALDAFRCRGQNALGLDVIASLRDAPEGAPAVALGPLTDHAFDSMCRQLGMDDAEQIAAFARMTGRSPGFAVAARGRVPLTRDAILARAAELSRPAVELLARIALLGGVGGDTLLGGAAAGASTTAALAELLGAALLTRKAGARGVTYTLGVAELASEIAGALGSFELAEDTCRWALAEESVTPRALMALASGPFPPQARRSLLERAAAQARREGLAGDETEALFALAAEPRARTRELVLRLERLTRNAGASHPQVMAWLGEVAEAEPAVFPLLRRRQAEQAARAGDTQLAALRADEARAAAQASGDRGAEALALATRGAVALYQADVALAETALREAAVVLSTLDLGDPEEVARLEHNRGVVALYGDRVDDAVRAFERSLDIKRRLGDRAGVRSCLLNLGLAQSRRGLYDAATATLSEAIALAQALKQPAGRAWCLAARADVEVRRGDARRAEQLVAEAEAIVEAPPVVRADLAILRGQAALLTGDATRARAALTALSLEQRSKDALLDARARVIEAGALLASLPARPREAARLCVQVVRAARSARLFEVEAQALALLGKARSQRATVEQPRYAGPMPEGGAELWSWLAELASGVDAETAVLQLLRALRKLTGAERALLIACDAEGDLERAWGVDLEGFALPSALERCDAQVVQDALQAGAPLYQRDITTLPGRGARLLVPQAPMADGSRAVLLFEHRFQPRAFDAVQSEQAARFAVLAGLAVRHSSARPEVSEAVASPFAAPLRAPAARQDSNETTVLPLREARRAFPGIVGNSRALQLALSKLDAAIGSDLPVLISGETGTGKELFARALHELGPRARGPLVAVNCAAVPDALFEAELFGHARGAFTGAERARAGLLARAQGGTLFLDEVAELPLARQASLLRVLESRRYRPVGSDEERALDVNIVAAANRSLAGEVESGRFRQDLLFRLNVIEIVVPPLRERLGDVPLLVRAFIERQGAGMELSAAALTALEGYGWPGNVRELEHHVQRLLALGVPRIERSHLPRSLRPAAAGRAALESIPAASVDPRDELTRALEQAQGNITHAARALGLTRHGLKKRMLRLGLRASQKEQA